MAFYLGKNKIASGGSGTTGASSETAISDLKINYLTEEQYKAALASNQINENELYFTPDDEIIKVIDNLTSTSKKDALSANQGKLLNDQLIDILKNDRSGKCREKNVKDNYVKLFDVEINVIYKSFSILFYLNCTQAGFSSSLVSLTLQKDNTDIELEVREFKTINFRNDLSPNLSVVINKNKAEVYYKMTSSNSPTLNILCMSRLRDEDNYGKTTVDCNTVVSSLPTGTTINATKLL